MELPAKVQPARLAKHGRSLEGTIPIAKLARLKAELVEDAGTIHASLEFTGESNGRIVSQMDLEGVVCVLCQRCLKPMQLNLQSSVTVLLATSHEAVDTDEKMDIYVMDDEYLDVFGFVEDEVLLALPFAPAHPPEDCAADIRAAAPAGRHRPFAGLQRLKR